ncbi:MAG: hypothetical protein O3C40_33415 [Planctomycetota bacterium]|nr:hypothetical protein [Planctomycetota bacterium]
MPASLDRETLAAIGPINDRVPLLTEANGRKLFVTSWERLGDVIKEKPQRLDTIRRVLQGDDHKLGRAARFALAAHAAGFGHLTRIGPNHLKDNPLALYIGIQAANPIPSDGPKRHLRLDDSCKGLFVTVAPNEADDWRFQEVLWQILENYKLDFHFELEGDCVIFKPQAR